MGLAAPLVGGLRAATTVSKVGSMGSMGDKAAGFFGSETTLNPARLQELVKLIKSDSTLISRLSNSDFNALSANPYTRGLLQKSFDATKSTYKPKNSDKNIEGPPRKDTQSYKPLDVTKTMSNAAREQVGGGYYQGSWNLQDKDLNLGALRTDNIREMERNLTEKNLKQLEDAANQAIKDAKNDLNNLIDDAKNIIGKEYAKVPENIKQLLDNIEKDIKTGSKNLTKDLKKLEEEAKKLKKDTDKLAIKMAKEERKIEKLREEIEELGKQIKENQENREDDREKLKKLRETEHEKREQLRNMEEKFENFKELKTRITSFSGKLDKTITNLTELVRMQAKLFETAELTRPPNQLEFAPKPGEVNPLTEALEQFFEFTNENPDYIEGLNKFDDAVKYLKEDDPGVLDSRLRRNFEKQSSLDTSDEIDSYYDVARKKVVKYDRYNPKLINLVKEQSYEYYESSLNNKIYNPKLVSPVPEQPSTVGHKSPTNRIKGALPSSEEGKSGGLPMSGSTSEYSLAKETYFKNENESKTLKTTEETEKAKNENMNEIREFEQTKEREINANLFKKIYKEVKELQILYDEYHIGAFKELADQDDQGMLQMAQKADEAVAGILKKAAAAEGAGGAEEFADKNENNNNQNQSDPSGLLGGKEEESHGHSKEHLTRGKASAVEHQTLSKTAALKHHTKKEPEYSTAEKELHTLSKTEKQYSLSKTSPIGDDHPDAHHPKFDGDDGSAPAGTSQGDTGHEQTAPGKTVKAPEGEIIAVEAVALAIEAEVILPEEKNLEESFSEDKNNVKEVEKTTTVTMEAEALLKTNDSDNENPEQEKEQKQKEEKKERESEKVQLAQEAEEAQIVHGLRKEVTDVKKETKKEKLEKVQLAQEDQIQELRKEADEAKEEKQKEKTIQKEEQQAEKLDKQGEKKTILEEETEEREQLANQGPEVISMLPPSFPLTEQGLANVRGAVEKVKEEQDVEIEKRTMEQRGQVATFPQHTKDAEDPEFQQFMEPLSTHIDKFPPDIQAKLRDLIKAGYDAQQKGKVSELQETLKKQLEKVPAESNAQGPVSQQICIEHAQMLQENVNKVTDKDHGEWREGGAQLAPEVSA
jgi:hypothetical protein